MFSKPSFMGQGPSKGSGPLPIIHEDADQAIQGGQVDEHYHLTEHEHTILLQKLFLAPVCAGSEIVFAGGDIVYTPEE